MKRCNLCNVEIPEDFQNLLCLECYEKTEKEIARKKEEEEQMKVELLAKEKEAPGGIRNPNYKENPEAEDKPQWEANIVQFAKSGHLLYPPTRMMYEYIKNWCIENIKKHPQYPKYMWKPKIVDVGSGCGVGSNVLSQEADFVWGIDKNEMSVKFAKEAFTRQKNGIYYNSQVMFDHLDILTDTRDFMQFDVVVAIEIIEHINDYKAFLRTIIDKFKKESTAEPTHWFISTPNRNHKSIRDDQPRNKYHVREWASEEFWDVLSDYFKDVEFMSAAGEPTDRTTTHTPLLAHCTNPK